MLAVLSQHRLNSLLSLSAPCDNICPLLSFVFLKCCLLVYGFAAVVLGFLFCFVVCPLACYALCSFRLASS